MESLKFLVVVTGMNCGKWAYGCLDSIRQQSYSNYDVTIVDDFSNDNTAALIKGFLRKNNLLWKFFTSSKNLGTVLARDKAIRAYSDDYDVIVWVDMDDKLKLNALERVAHEYKIKDIWLTYGNFIDSTGNICFTSSNINYSKIVHEANSYRLAIWKFAHLRTFRKSLYLKLTNNDLFVPFAKLYPDANMLYCMMEMAGENRMSGILDVLYEYNMKNPMSIYHRAKAEDREAELALIKRIPAKHRIKSL